MNFFSKMMFFVVFVFCIQALYIGLYAQNNTEKINCVCIDAGHGGVDAGALGYKIKEKILH